MDQALALALFPMILGLAVGRWWLLLAGGLMAVTMAVQGAAAGLPAGPLAVLILVPFAGCALGVAAREAMRLRRN
jgi:hypothetical protein